MLTLAALASPAPAHAQNAERVEAVEWARAGDPDALDSIVPMAFGNLALDLILRKQFGRLVSIHRGYYDSVPIANVTAEKKVVDVQQYYHTERLRPVYEFDGMPLFIMTSD